MRLRCCGLIGRMRCILGWRWLRGVGGGVRMFGEFLGFECLSVEMFMPGIVCPCQDFRTWSTKRRKISPLLDWCLP